MKQTVKTHFITLNYIHLIFSTLFYQYFYNITNNKHR